MSTTRFVEVRHDDTWRLDLHTPDRVLAHGRAQGLARFGMRTRVVVLDQREQFVEEEFAPSGAAGRQPHKQTRRRRGGPSPARRPEECLVKASPQDVRTVEPEAEPVKVETLPSVNRSRLPASVTYLGNTVNSAARFARIVFQAGLGGKGVETAAVPFVKIMRGLELGIGPMEALSELHVINGKVGCSGKLLLKKVREAGCKHRWAESTGAVCRIELTTPDGEVFEDEFTIEEATAAGLLKKLDTPWQNYPKRMLRWRALSYVVNNNVPELIGGGMLLAEELGAEVDAAGNILSLPAETVPNPAKKNGKAGAAKEPSEIDLAANDGDAEDRIDKGGELGADGPAAGTAPVARDPAAPDPAAPAVETVHRVGTGATSAAPGMVGMIRKLAIEAGLWNSDEAAVCFNDGQAGQMGFDKGAGYYAPGWLAEQGNADEIVRTLQDIRTERAERLERHGTTIEERVARQGDLLKP